MSYSLLVVQKKEIYIMTKVDRQTRYFPAIVVVAQRSQATAQQMLDSMENENFWKPEISTHH